MAGTIKVANWGTDPQKIDAAAITIEVEYGGKIATIYLKPGRLPHPWRDYVPGELRELATVLRETLPSSYPDTEKLN